LPTGLNFKKKKFILIFKFKIILWTVGGQGSSVTVCGF